MFIVFDTNVWQTELALNSAAGAAVRFYVQQRGATVVVPEVVRLELERNLTRKLCEQAERIARDHRELLSIFGSLKEVVLPTSDQIRDKVAEILPRLDVPMRDIPFSVDAARSSFLKTIDKMAPSDKSQEFKDGVIWANCVALLADANVYLVTADKAFYEGRNYSSGLAKTLQAEAETYKYQLRLFPDIAGLLAEIRIELNVDKDHLVKAFLLEESNSSQSLLDQAGFVLAEPSEIGVKLFATELSSQLYIEFAISFRCEDASTRGRPDARLEIEGDGSYNTSNAKFGQLRKRQEKLVYADEGGQQKMQSVILAVGSAITVHRLIRHTIRSPLL